MLSLMCIYIWSTIGKSYLVLFEDFFLSQVTVNLSAASILPSGTTNSCLLAFLGFIKEVSFCFVSFLQRLRNVER